MSLLPPRRGQPRIPYPPEPREEAALKAIGEGGATSAEIARRMRVSVPVARGVLRTLIAQGRVRRWTRLSTASSYTWC